MALICTAVKTREKIEIIKQIKHSSFPLLFVFIDLEISLACNEQVRKEEDIFGRVNCKYNR